MNKYIVLVLVIVSVQIANAQFRDTRVLQPGVKESIVNDDPNMFLGLIDLSKFSMKHSFSLNYSAFGDNGIALGVYTNSMQYRFSDKLDIQLDASIVQSPYNSFGKEFQNQLNGFYISRAELNYKPWENFDIHLQYRNIPQSYYLTNYRNRFFNRYDDIYFPGF